MPQYRYIKVEVNDFVAVITLNNPDKLNAWSYPMDAEIRTAVGAAGEDPKVRAIIFTGAGRGFCAGADMAGLQDASNGAISVNVEFGISAEQGAVDDLVYLTRVPKPIFAAINGPAAGFGTALAIFCDYRFIAENAKFTTAFARRGLVAEYGVAWMLARQVGIMNAMDLLTARMVSGVEAGQLGFARTLPAEGFLARVVEFAREVAKTSSPRSLGVIKTQLYNAFTQTLEEARIVAAAEALKSFDSEDFKEGVAHFLEKRPSAFTGR